LFFGRKAEEGKTERITHVGIYLDNREYIHSSGRVQINSFDRSSPLFNEYNLNRYVRARRIIASAPQVTEVTLR
jgi:cell wall-associated NlpC family hydrolase